jgi:putative transport protein
MGWLFELHKTQPIAHAVGLLAFVSVVGMALGSVKVKGVVLVGIFARMAWKMNYMDLSGQLAGSMTDPPALAFASNIAGSDAPTMAYATVYPLTTLLRILSAQVLAIALFR